MAIIKASQERLVEIGGVASQLVRRFRRKKFSNFNEEHLLRDFIAELLTPDTSRTAVDIGAGDGIKSSNTYALFRNGWTGVGIEGHHRRARLLVQAYKKLPGVAAHRGFVTPFNVVPLLESYSIEREFGVLSLDIDSYDYWVLDALLARFRPRLIVTEINEKIPPPVKFRVNYDPDFRLTHHFFGYSIESLSELCARHGYSLIALEYNNAFLAPSELHGVRPLEVDDAYRRGYLERADRKERFRDNHDMEILHTLSSADALVFIKRFFARHEGKYDLSLSARAECASDSTTIDETSRDLTETLSR